jgi:response regulator of citrate/malate metabolism
MDIEKVHLINSIFTASTAFLSALNSLRGHYSEATELVKNIKTLRKDLALLDKYIVTSGLQLLEKQYRRHNLQQM